MGKPFTALWFIIVLTVVSFFIVFTQILPQFPKFKIDLSLGGVTFARDLIFKLGLDLVGGTHITLRADMSQIDSTNRKNAIEAARNTVERRVNPNGVKEIVVQTAQVAEEYRVVVEIPNVQDVNEAVSLVGKTAKLEFREIKEATDSALFTEPTGLSGADLKDAQATFDQTSGQPVVSFRVLDSSQNKFFEATQKLIGKGMAIFLDNEFISAPVVQSAIRDSGQITGNFTIEETKRLALQLNAGALPVPMEVIAQQNLPPTLGEESIHKSLIAGAIGFIIVMIFMAAFYGWYGILADMALIIYALIVLAIFKLLPVTLTLAGIEGFILSVGMAVDANILIFERMKEEKRWGKPRVAATELGFIRAWTSIRDSNVASLMTSAILYYFGTGIVRGFAVTLAIGILISMFSAIVVTRTFLRMMYR